MADGTPDHPLRLRDRILKRGFDVTAAAVGLAASAPLIAAGWAAARVDTGASGFFTQERIGRGGRRFRVIKLRTMRPGDPGATTVTTRGDARITPVGALLRRYKIDELPQLINVLRGEMSFVGPRPDVPGFADRLTGADRVLLAVRPGITGPASLKYRNEEELLADRSDPERYNREVIWPDKVAINRAYVESYSFLRDLGYILETVLGGSEGSP